MNAKEAAHILARAIPPVEDATPAAKLIAGEFYRKASIRDYAMALKNSTHCSSERTNRAFEQAYFYVERAVQMGISEEKINLIFAGLRRYWIPRLMRGK